MSEHPSAALETWAIIDSSPASARPGGEGPESPRDRSGPCHCLFRIEWRRGRDHDPGSDDNRSDCDHDDNPTDHDGNNAGDHDRRDNRGIANDHRTARRAIGIRLHTGRRSRPSRRGVVRGSRECHRERDRVRPGLLVHG